MKRFAVVYLVTLMLLAGCAAGKHHRLHAVTSACALRHCTLAEIARDVTDADYRGEVGNLRGLSERLSKISAESPNDADARYWLGFAKWRIALNWINDGATRSDVDPVLISALAEFESLVARDPRNVEAHAGIVGVLGARLFLSGGDAEVVQTAMQRGGPSLAALREPARTNLRAA
ncbi:MAG: hypothetical protein JNJ55_12215, partial [Betaproteobacteria bacterium]|nr:hypothetical protein [Betaproteobacteria bacterium]